MYLKHFAPIGVAGGLCPLFFAGDVFPRRFVDFSETEAIQPQPISLADMLAGSASSGHKPDIEGLVGRAALAKLWQDERQRNAGSAGLGKKSTTGSALRHDV